MLLLTACARTHNLRKEAGVGPPALIKDIKVLTLNIRMGAGLGMPRKPPFDLESTDADILRIVQAVGSADPDIVALQEVAGIGQARKLAQMLHYNYAYTSHLAAFKMGLAVLSKFEIIASESKQILFDEWDTRRALICEIRIGARRFYVVNVHYHLGGYRRQVKATLNAVGALASPVILLGDFNRKESDVEMQPILQKFADTCRAVDTPGSRLVLKRGTWQYPKWKRIDYIFADSRFFKVFDAGLLSEKHWNASDHIGYYAHLSLRE